ncbi:MAG: hypothetical protein AAGC55_30805, partial [Myxococcota bacterium]
MTTTLTAIKATHVGSLELAGEAIPCAVLEDGRRVISTSQFQRFIGARGSVNYRNSRCCKLPPFLAADNLQAAVTARIQAIRRSCKPVRYRPPGVGSIERGYVADL